MANRQTVTIEVDEFVEGRLMYVNHGKKPGKPPWCNLVIDDNEQGELAAWSTMRVVALLYDAGVIDLNTKQDGTEYYKVVGEPEIRIEKKTMEREGGKTGTVFNVSVDGSELRGSPQKREVEGAVRRASGGSSGAKRSGSLLDLEGSRGVILLVASNLRIARAMVAKQFDRPEVAGRPDVGGLIPVVNTTFIELMQKGVDGLSVEASLKQAARRAPAEEEQPKRRARKIEQTEVLAPPEQSHDEFPEALNEADDDLPF